MSIPSRKPVDVPENVLVELPEHLGDVSAVGVDVPVADDERGCADPGVALGLRNRGA